MRFRASLRFRVMLSYALLGAATSTVLAGSLYVLTIHMEERLIAETLSAELEDFMQRYAADPSTVPPAGKTIRSYVTGVEKRGDLPAGLGELSAGFHRIRLEAGSYFAEVRIDEGLHFVVLYNDQAIRNREAQFRTFLLGGVFAMTLLSALLGWWLGRRVIYPVTELAARVARLQPEDSHLALAEDFPRDEVGDLAHSFDAYQTRLVEFINRERAFTGDVSHELRTPLAVIEGAAELLLADPELDDKKRQRLRRIERATREASEMTSALLLLAREEDGKASTGAACRVEDVLKQVVDEQLAAQGRQSVNLLLSIEGHPVLSAEPGLLRVVLSNLIRNAYTYTPEGSVKILLEPGQITITDTGIGMTDSELARVFERHYRGSEQGGAGIGLSLVKRICQRYNWAIDISSKAGVGTMIRMSFSRHKAGKG